MHGLDRFVRSRLRWAPALLAVIVLPSSAVAVSFTRILDPNNPVVTDVAESGGGSWEDVNGDGLLDLFVAKGNLSSQNDDLYLDLGGGSFLKVRTGPVVTSGGASIGGVWGDWNADGRLDLFVTNRTATGNFLYRGLGDSAFVAESGIAPVTDLAQGNSGSWLDLDGDGDLDLYVVNFQSDDFIYLNSGPPSWSLVRTTLPTIGIGTEFSIHGGWGDFDDDGDLDLFVGNGGPQNDDLYVNQGSLTFTRRSLGDGRSTIGGSWGDFDNDGDLDLFEANNLNQVSTLFVNGGAPSWTLAPAPVSVFPTHAASAVGSAWGDVDNDGDLDLLVADDNGQNEALFLNSGPPGYTFTALSSDPIVSSGGNSFGCSFADIDRDGDLDAFVANRSNQVDFLFRNDGPSGHWLGVRCLGTVTNPGGVGARVRVLATLGGVPRWQMQQVLPLTGYNSQNPELHFGLGAATVADSVEVRWQDGTRQLLAGVGANQLVQIEQGVTVGVAPSLASYGVGLEWIGARPARSEVRLAITLPEAATVELALIDVQGRVRARSLESHAAGRSTTRLFPSEELVPGVYWVRLRTRQGSCAVRVVWLRSS